MSQVSIFPCCCNGKRFRYRLAHLEQDIVETETLIIFTPVETGLTHAMHCNSHVYMMLASGDGSGHRGCWQVAHSSMGSSMRLSSWRAHRMCPATGGAILGSLGARLPFS